MAGEARNSVDARSPSAATIGTHTSSATAESFARAVAARDYIKMFSALARDARFRYLIPPGPGHTIGAADMAAKFLEWFGDADVLRIESIEASRSPTGRRCDTGSWCTSGTDGSRCSSSCSWTWTRRG